MNTQKRTYRKNISYVEHKKNFPRTLATFAKYHQCISIKYDTSLKAWEFECLNKIDNLSSNHTIVYDPIQASELLRDTNAIHKAIDGMFEYKKYAYAIKDFVNEMQENKNFGEKEVSFNTFFSKESSYIKSLLKSKLETKFQITLSEATTSKIYTSIMNRIRFKPIYCDENEEYYTYNSSQLDHFALCKSISRPKDFAIHEQIRKNYEIYDKYSYVYRHASSFKDFLSRNDSFGINDPITKEWKEYYFFLKRSGVFETLFYSMDFLERYMIFFIGSEAQPVNLFSPKGKLFKSNVKKHLTKILTKKSMKSIDIDHFTMIYKALMEEIKEDWYSFLSTCHQWPEIFGTYPLTTDTTIKLKKNYPIASEPCQEEKEAMRHFIPIPSFGIEDNQGQPKKRPKQHPEIPF